MSSFTNMFRAALSQTVRVRALFAAFAFLIGLFAVQSASAATFTVTTTADRNNPTCNSGVSCSLREAVKAANAAATNDTINFAIPAASCPAGVCTITLTLGELAVNDDATSGTLTITNSTGASNLLISGNNASRVFFVNGNLTINGVTITRGNGTGRTASNFDGIGGGIFNNSIMTLTNSTVSGNTAQLGGGIENFVVTLTLTNSTVSGNTASDEGGGIFNDSGTSTLTNSTVSGNTASNGGIGNDSGTLNLTSVTVTQNKSTDASCTTCAGGINTNNGTANLKNTIVAVNAVANTASSPDFGGAVAAGSSFNLIGNGQGTTGISNNTASNQVGTPASPIDPKLGPLANNGGATQTHALLFGSPALDKGNAFTLTTDQRGAGFSRPVNLPDATYPNAPPLTGDGADIGAFEAQTAPAAPTAATVSVSGRVLTMNGRGITNMLLTLTDSQGNVKTTVSAKSGYYRFDDIEAGSTYIITATGKRFSFSQPTQVLNINEETEEVNFIANSEKRLRIF